MQSMVLHLWGQMPGDWLQPASLPLEHGTNRPCDCSSVPILRLIAPGDREGFHEMLAHELQGFREPLPDGERRAANNMFHGRGPDRPLSSL